MMFPPDEGNPQSDIDVPIPIVDDTVDEAESQFFYILLEVLNATSLGLVTKDRDLTVSLCNIRDDDGK